MAKSLDVVARAQDALATRPHNGVILPAEDVELLVAYLTAARNDYAELRVKLQRALNVDLSTRPLPSINQMLDTLIERGAK